MNLAISQEQRLLLLRNATPILFVAVFLFLGCNRRAFWSWKASPTR
ncbi:MAG: hypothetical protein HC915_15630 [Anaerolineae bacterium]|nr:hypothetical protein [Anaerolineae bacterium]